MNQTSLILLNVLLMINSISNESGLNKAWESICKINSCEPTLQECISDGCFGKTNCQSCVKDYNTNCSRCVEDIFHETAEIILPGNRKTIACNSHNQLHTAVCNFYCRSLSKSNYKCEIISDFHVCDCFETTKFTTVTTTTTTTPSTKTRTTTPVYPSNKC
jgi:hypothetical protein